MSCFSKHLTVIAFCLISAACSTIYKAPNSSMNQINEDAGYRPHLSTATGKSDEHRVILAFSGGGTRAAALSYGILQELRDTKIEKNGQTTRLLDEVDSISAVSGGSFTAAYYGVFGEKIFEDYEDAFLRQSVQGSLIRKLFSPSHWFNSLFSGFDRTEMAISYYDQTIFKGATFGDIPLQERPYIAINATDLGKGIRFTFTQSRFDLICSDLNDFSIARAVTASSAVPVAFPSIVLKNYAGECDTQTSPIYQQLQNLESSSIRQEEFKESLLSYNNTEERPYIHLVDGGISDNLGLRAMIDRINTFGIDSREFQNTAVKSVLVILVNAEVSPETGIDQTPKKPSAKATIGAFSNAQIGRYNTETRERLRETIDKSEQLLREQGHDISIMMSEISFDTIEKSSIRQFFNNLPTSLELNDEELDRLIYAGKVLLQKDENYQKFLQTIEHPVTLPAIDANRFCELFPQECPAGEAQASR